MRIILSVGATTLMAIPALGGTLELKVEVPNLKVAEYHRPYVAMWIEKPDQTVVGNLAIWYDSANTKDKGEKWLKDLRQWWRRSGRDLTMPADGLSSATRPPGHHAVSFAADHPVLSSLQPGDYQLVVEAAREVGGREVIRIPFTWPAAGQATEDTAAGKEELGTVILNVSP